MEFLFIFFFSRRRIPIPGWGLAALSAVSFGDVPPALLGCSQLVWTKLGTEPRARRGRGMGQTP